MTRIAYLDCLRGLAMLMVIYCHVENYCFHLDEPEIIGEFFSISMLPLFFFVSGFFAPVRLTNCIIVKRVRFVLIPTIVMFFLYVGVCSGNYSQLYYGIGTEYKLGYWFTIVLFEMNFVHWCISISTHNKIAIMATMVLVSVLMIPVKNWDWYYNNAFLSNWLGLRLFASHFPYYIFGLICMLYKEYFHRLLSNELLVGGLFVAFFVLYIYPSEGFYRALLLGGISTVIAYQVCHKASDFFSDSTLIGKLLVIVGKNTLSIYLINYFFFFGLEMTWVNDYFSSHEQGWIIFAFAAVITIFIAFASIVVKKVISISKPLQYIMLGK